MKLLLALACLITLLLLGAPGSIRAQDAGGPITLKDRGTFVVFPDRVSFNVQISSRAPVAQVVLEYGVDKRTCGNITAKAFPKFTPGTSMDVSWTWEMLQTGSEPPGATIWYRWRVTDRDGNSAVTPDARVTWIDRTYSWQQISDGNLNLHWYAGDRAFAQDLLDTMVAGVAQLTRMTGVAPQAPVHLYVYGDTREMQEAMLYEPSWTGGAAFPENNITIIGIHPDNLEWGKRTIVHELTHLLVGQLTFSCGENVPTWLNEGVAVYAEGGLDPWSEGRFRQAVAANQLLSWRDLTSGFSAHPDVADLSYSQSFSMVRYLVESRGPERLLALLAQLRDGKTVEAGLREAYGAGLDELEDGWRRSIGAGPRPRVSLPAAQAPTPIPTYAPVASAPTSPVPPPDRRADPTATTGPTAAPTAPASAAAPTPEPLAAAGGAPPQAPARRGPDTRLLAAALLFFTGLALAGTASWKLLGGRAR